MAVAAAAVAFAFLPSILQGVLPAGILPAETAEPEGALAGGLVRTQPPHSPCNSASRVLRGGGCTACASTNHVLSTSATLPCSAQAPPMPPFTAT
jgi:hypothetical protein